MIDQHSALTESLSTGFADWLTEEHRSASAGNNRVLDDWEQYQADTHRHFDDPANKNSGKPKGHYDRLKLAATSMLEFPDMLKDEYFAGRQIFYLLMFVSGRHRIQSFMQSSSAEHYDIYRHSKPAGVSISEAVGERVSLATFAGSLITGHETIADGQSLAERTLLVNEQQLVRNRQTHDISYVSRVPRPKLGLKKVLDQQRTWLGLASDYAVCLASQRDGNLSSVPVLEPKSITEEPRVIYPFKDLSDS